MSPQSDSKGLSARGVRTIDWRLALALWVMLGGLCVVLAHTFAMGVI